MLWLALIVCLLNLFWIAFLRAAVMPGKMQGGVMFAAAWLDLVFPIAMAVALLIALQFFKAADPPAQRAGELRLRRLLARSNGSYLVIDKNMRIVSIDAQPGSKLQALAAGLIGCQVGCQMGRQMSHVGQVAQMAAQVPATGLNEQLAVETIDADGQPLRICLDAEPLFDPGGAFDGYEATASVQSPGVDASRVAEAISDCAEAILMTDAELDQPGPRIIYANPAFCALTGYSADEVLGATPRLLQGPGTDRKVLDLLRQKLAGGEAVSMEALNYRKSGEPFYVAWQISAVRDRSGAICAYLAILQDVTARREAEFRLRDQNLRLEEQLCTSSRDAGAAAGELESFSHSVSHDLRAPLRIIEGFAEILREDYRDRLDMLGNDHLKRISAAATRMSQMIASLSSMARVCSAPLHKESVDLSRIAEELLAAEARASPGRKVAVIVAPAIRAEGDPAMLHELMRCLLANAWKFSSAAASAQIEVGMTSEGGCSRYFVRDNGAGFDMKYGDRLFGVFQRLHSQSEFPGIGTGLATAQRLVARHRGKIWAEATVGGGATFHFTFWDSDGILPPAGPSRASPPQD
jgi:PAS domain S-box-containing protein